MFSGLMLSQYTADMQIVEQRILSAPASIQSIPASILKPHSLVENVIPPEASGESHQKNSRSPIITFGDVPSGWRSRLEQSGNPDLRGQAINE